MKIKVLLSLAVLFAFAFAAIAADIDGTWTAQTQGRNGQTMQQTFKLKADGDKLTGTISGGRGGEAEISDGKIKGNKVSFNVKRTFGDNTFVMKYTGTVSGDELKLSMTVEGRDMPAREFVAKREK